MSADKDELLGIRRDMTKDKKACGRFDGLKGCVFPLGMQPSRRQPQQKESANKEDGYSLQSFEWLKYYY